MPILPAKHWSCRRDPGGRVAVRAEDGFLMVEVIISALLVGMIVVATLTGFGVQNRVTADERARNEATVLAAQSQEQMRSDPANALNALQSGHAYAQTVGGTNFTITQKATLIPASEPSAACSATETTKQTGSYMQISSSVTWPAAVARGRKPVAQTSVITPPTGSALEVDVTNGAATGAIVVPGVSALVKFTPEQSSSVNTLQGTTSSLGCFVLGGIPSTAATVEVLEKNGLVNGAGTLTTSPKTLTIAPNITTHDPVTLAYGGAIEAKFAWRNSTSYTPKKNNGTALSAESVKGDTFVAFNNKMNVAPDFEVGSTVPQTNSEGLSELVTGTYGATALTPKQTPKYPAGNLFPFPEAKWVTYAGDCPANDAEAVSGGSVKDVPISVKPAETSTVTVPMARLEVIVFKNKAITPVPAEYEQGTTSFKVTTTNTGCNGTKPNNATAFSGEPKRTQQTLTGTERGGHVANNFVPLGPVQVCLSWHNAGNTEFWTYTEKFNLKSSENEYLAEFLLGEKVAGTRTYSYKPSPSTTSETVTVTGKKNTSTTNECP
jgi:Tfp pilus assembly protein PilV